LVWSTSAQRRSAPGSHQVSSSQNATYGVVTSRTAMLRATAPALRRSASSVISGCSHLTIAAVPSREALSATITAGRSGSAASLPRILARDSRRSRVITTTVTRASGPARSWPALLMVSAAGVGQEADPRVAPDVAAAVAAMEVVAGDPQPRARQQHVVGAPAA